MSQSSTPPSRVLPPEIWTNVFYQHTEPEHLWTQCREVSCFWRSEIPKVFAAKQLQDPKMTEIEFHCGVYRWAGCNHIMGMVMHFSRFDPGDSSRCIFAESNETKRRGKGKQVEKYERIKYDAWKEKVELYLGDEEGSRDEGGRNDLPAHTLRVKKIANDTHLPELACDYEKREISFEWFGMFDLLYREEKDYDHCMRRLLEASKPPPGSAPADGDTIIKAMIKFAKGTQEARRQARRRRIVRFFKEFGHWDLDPDDFYEEEEDFCLERISAAVDRGFDIRYPEDRDARRAERQAERESGQDEDEEEDEEDEEDEEEEEEEEKDDDMSEEEEEEDEDEDLDSDDDYVTEVPQYSLGSHEMGW